MLVKAVRNVHDDAFGNITKGRLLVVYAIEERGEKKFYYVFPLGAENPSGENDPLWFEAGNFEVVRDDVAADWSRREVADNSGRYFVTSFPEWFENGFYYRAHDWSLDGADYDIVDHYKKKYEQAYKSYSE